MSNDTPVLVDTDVYIHSNRQDGLYESDIECAICCDPIGAWQFDTQDSTVELFHPYWMLDMDNNYNVCLECYDTTLSQPKHDHEIR